MSSNNPFAPGFDDLPNVLPVFPLGGALLLPRQSLPLNIFEPRYLNMVLDALGGDRNIGMIQPESSAGEEPPAVYRVGCAGRITAFNETNDGRLLINLSGVCRFEVAREIDGVRGYRRVNPNWQPYASDLEDAPALELDFVAFEKLALGFFKAKGLEVKWDALKQLPHASLVDFLAMNLPVTVQEKQALLESPEGVERSRILTSVLGIGAAQDPSAGATRH